MAVPSGTLRVLFYAGALGAYLLASNAWAQALLVADQSLTASGLRSSQVGRVATFVCPSTFALNPQVWGTDVYHYDSAICPAAVHAGVRAAGTVSQVTIKIGPAAEQLQGTQRNGITSLAYPSAATTYSFVGNDEAGEITWYTTYAAGSGRFQRPDYRALSAER
jgi:hypothetical protein